MKKLNKKESEAKPEASIADIVKDWNDNYKDFKAMAPNMNFNNFLVYCTEKYTILPK